MCVFPGRIFLPYFLCMCVYVCVCFFYNTTAMNTISEFLCGGCDEPVLRCCARIDLGFFSLFHCVIRWPALCHYRAQAWVEAAGEQGSALSLSKILLRMCPSVCLSLHLSTSIYLSVLLSALSLFPSHSLSMQMHKCKFSLSSLRLEMLCHSPSFMLSCLQLLTLVVFLY